MDHTDAANPFRRPLTLHDWHFVYSLPVTPDEFVASAANGGFAYVQAALGGYRDWHEYELVLDRAKGVFNRFAAAGLNMLWGPRPWVFCRLVRRQHVVILLTHAARATESQDGKLEFRGETVPFRVIISKISPYFAGILDVCACEAEGIQELLKQRAPKCASKVADKQLTLGYWIAYYAEFLRLFTEVPTTYYDAIMRTRALI